MLGIEELQARRALYVEGRDGVAKQMEQARAQLAQLERQVAIQDGALAAIDDLLQLLAPTVDNAPEIELTAEELQNAEFVPA